SDLQVDMSDTGSGWYHFPRFACALFSQTTDIHWIGGHLDGAVCPMPCTPGTITINFQTVAIGIRDIQRFTHQMIALTNPPTDLGKPQHFATKICSSWEEDSYVIEARCPAWLRCSSWNLYQFQQWLFILTAKDHLPRCLLTRL